MVVEAKQPDIAEDIQDNQDKPEINPDQRTKPEVDFENKADDFFKDKGEKETPEGSSTSKETPDKETEDSKGSGSDQQKTDKPKEEKGELSKEEQEKADKDVEEGKLPFHKHSAWIKQRKQGEEKDTVIAELQKSAVPKETLDKIDKVINSRAYIQSDLESQGKSKEFIAKTLEEKGFEVEAAPKKNDLDIVAEGLGTTVEQLEKEGTKDAATSIAKIVSIMLKNSSKDFVTKDEIAPLEKNSAVTSQKELARTMMSEMKEAVEVDKELDFVEDVLPILNKFMEDNPNAEQPDVKKHFDKVYPRMVIDRLKGGKRQEARDGKKGELRQDTGKAGVKINPKLKKTGNFEEDSDSFFANIGMAD